MKILKRALLLAVAVILAISVNIGGFSVLSARAGVFTGKFFEGNVITRVKEGEEITVPQPFDSSVDFKIVTPAGLDITEGGTYSAADKNYSYRAAQLGHYKVTYFEVGGNAEYSYNVFCYEHRDYYIRINEKMEKIDGKDTPVFMPTYLATGDKLLLPTFELVYKNSKGEVVVVDTGDDIEYRSASGDKDEDAMMGVVYSDGMVSTRNSNELTIAGTGSLVITFWAKISAVSTKKFTKEYTINVQKEVNDDTPPVLNTLSMTGTANLNSLYTLPIATATDAYEKNVFIDVSVVDKDGQRVKEYKANDYGYADTTVTPVNNVEFNNKDVLSFYPVKEGNYTVYYTAYDRSGASSTHDYNIVCSDKLGPVIHELATDIIPTKWGFEGVTKRSESSTDENPQSVAVSKTFKLPLPTAIDNVDKTEDLTLTVKLTNPANYTIASWSGAMNKFVSNDPATTEGVELTAAYSTYFKDGYKSYKLKADSSKLMEFSFEYLNMKTNNNEGHSLLNEDREMFGDWTWTYEIKDTKGNGASGSSRKTVVTNLSRYFNDLIAPKIDENNLDIPKYVLINNENDIFNVPLIPLYSDDDTRLTADYKMFTTADISGFTTPIEFDGIKYTVINEFEVEGGESYNIEEIGNNYFMLISKDNKDYAFALSKTEPVKFEFVAKDDVGNSSDVREISIEIFYSGDVAQEIAIRESDAWDADAGEFEAAEGAAFTLTGFKQKSERTLGGFVIPGILEKYIDYTGVEVDITDKDGEPVSFSAYIYNRGFKDVSGDWEACNTNETPEIYNIYVKDIKLTPKKDGMHHVNIRVYDISGNSVVYGYGFEVAEVKNNSGTVGKSAAKIEQKGTIRTEYELGKSYRVKDITTENIIVRNFKGFGFGLMNYNFTGYYTDTYYITESLIEDFADWATDKATKLSHQTSYSIALKNEEKPTIEIHDIMPKNLPAITDQPSNQDNYESGKFIELPVITGFTKYENSEIECKVTFNSENVKASKLYQKLDFDGAAINSYTFKSKETLTNPDDANESKEVEYRFTGVFAFPAASEGDYTVTITAKASGGNTTSTHTIRVGDKTPVDFKVDNLVKTANVGDTFYRTTPVVISGTVKKIEVTLKDPDKNVISTARKSYASIQEFEKDLESTYKFEKDGDYDLIYEITGTNGSTSVLNFTIKVSKDGTGTTPPPIALTVVLIIIGVLLIAGVLVYVIRFRAVKK